MKVSELRKRLANLSSEYDDFDVLVEIFGDEGENHITGLSELCVETRCADEPALFLQGHELEESEVEPLAPLFSAKAAFLSLNPKERTVLRSRFTLELDTLKQFDEWEKEEEDS